MPSDIIINLKSISYYIDNLSVTKETKILKKF